MQIKIRSYHLNFCLLIAIPFSGCVKINTPNSTIYSTQENYSYPQYNSGLYRPSVSLYTLNLDTLSIHYQEKDIPLKFDDSLKLEFYFDSSPDLNEAKNIVTHSKLKVVVFNFVQWADSIPYIYTQMRIYSKYPDSSWELYSYKYLTWQKSPTSISREIFIDIPIALLGSTPAFEWAIVRTITGEKFQIPDVPTLYIRDREKFKFE